MKKIWQSPSDVGKDIHVASIGKVHNYYMIAGNDKDFLVLRKEHVAEAAEALLKDIGLGWKPFPDSFSGLPEVHKKYDVTRLDFEEKPIVDQRIFYNVDLWVVAKVIAFRELPAPYNPEATHES